MNIFAHIKNEEVSYVCGSISCRMPLLVEARGKVEAEKEIQRTGEVGPSRREKVR